MEKLKSRKLWIAIGGALSVLLTELFGIDIAPEAIGGLVLIVGSYIFGQGWVDKKQVEAEVQAFGQEAYVELVRYARGLEVKLAEVVGGDDAIS